MCAGSCARREGKGKALGEVNHPAIFHQDQAFSGIAFTCTTVLAEKSFHGEFLPWTSTSFPDSTLYWQASIWSLRSWPFLVVGSRYFCVCAVTALLRLQPLSLPLEPLPTILHQACRLSSGSSLPMGLWGVPWMGAPLPGYSLHCTIVSCLRLPVLNLQKPFVEVCLFQ